MRKINLSVDTVVLAGYPYGQQIYLQQVKPFLPNNLLITDVEIMIPAKVERIISSFVQGFFAELLIKYSLDELKKHLHLISTNNLCPTIFKMLE